MDACYTLGGWARGQGGGGTGGGGRLKLSESYFFDNDDINCIFLYSCTSLSFEYTPISYSSSWLMLLPCAQDLMDMIRHELSGQRMVKGSFV